MGKTPMRRRLQPKRPLMPLWPDAGKRLGFSRNFTYAAAKLGKIPGAEKIGGKWVVWVEPFERKCAEG